MLIESVVRTTLGVKHHVVKRVVWPDGGFAIDLDVWKRRCLLCGSCGTLGRVRDRLERRTWKHVPLWGMPVMLSYAPARVHCRRCGKVRVEAIPWRQGKCRLSTRLIWLLASWGKLLPWQQVARLFGVHFCGHGSPRG